MRHFGAGEFAGEDRCGEFDGFLVLADEVVVVDEFGLFTGGAVGAVIGLGFLPGGVVRFRSIDVAHIHAHEQLGFVYGGLAEARPVVAVAHDFPG